MFKQKIQKMGFSVIKFARKIFAGTPIQKFKITAYIYDKLFHSLYGNGDINVDYKGMKLVVPGKDSTIVPSIVGGYFETIELDLFRLAATKSKTIVDVGANIGLFSVLAAQNARVGGVVHAFEPVPENIEYFKRNAGLNDISSKLQLNELAVGDKKGSLTLYISKEDIAIHSASKAHASGKSSISVPMVSLDDYVKENKLKIDLLKIDVEGYDGFVLKGASEMIRTSTPTIFIEYDPIALVECGFSERDFTEILFKPYSHCFRVDEVSSRIARISMSEVTNLKPYRNENFVLTNDAELASEIERFSIK
jgi:FkbM family methyltransferase